MGVVAYLSLSRSGREVGWGRRLFEAGRLLTFFTFKMGAYSRWALIRGWALIRINTVIYFDSQCQRLFFKSIKTPDEKSFLPILIWIVSTISRIACWVE